MPHPAQNPYHLLVRHPPAAPHAGKPGDVLMLDAILITVGIVVAACSVSYKLLLLMYRPTPEGRTQTPTIADAVDSRRS